MNRLDKIVIIIVFLLTIVVMSNKAHASSPIVMVSNDIDHTHGTGFLVDNMGDLVTAFHVVDGTTTPTVYYKSKDYPGLVIATNKLADIALVHIIEINTDYLKIEEVYPGIKYKLGGFPDDIKNTVVKGVTGNIHNQFVFLKGKVCHGHSGGPIIDIKTDKVIGFADKTHYKGKAGSRQCGETGEGITSDVIHEFLKHEGIEGK